jgi:hypothetical protein
MRRCRRIAVGATTERVRLAAAALFALSGCARTPIPPCPESECGAHAPELATETSGTRITIGTDAFQIVFDTAVSGAAIEVRATGDNLLYQGFEKNERLMAISHYDNWYSWRTDAPPAVRLDAGPALSQLELDWVAGGMSGTSRYVVHPDGRVHRDESVTVSGAGVAPDYFLAYATLALSAWDTVRWAVNGEAERQTDVRGTYQEIRESPDQTSETGYFCALHRGRGDVFGWSHHEASPTFPWGFRVAEISNGPSPSFHLLLASEWVRAGTVVPGAYRGQVLMDIRSDGNCDVVARHANAYITPDLGTVLSGALVLGSGGDLDNDGYDEGSGFWRLSGETIEVALRGVEGLTLRLVDFDSRLDPAVFVDGALLRRGGEYVYQGGTLFLAGAAEGARLLVEP